MTAEHIDDISKHLILDGHYDNSAFKSYISLLKS